MRKISTVLKTPLIFFVHENIEVKHKHSQGIFQAMASLVDITFWKKKMLVLGC